jgi:hypothetical protein
LELAEYNAVATGTSKFLVFAAYRDLPNWPLAQGNPVSRVEVGQTIALLVLSIEL